MLEEILKEAHWEQLTASTRFDHFLAHIAAGMRIYAWERNKEERAYLLIGSIPQQEEAWKELVWQGMLGSLELIPLQPMRGVEKAAYLTTEGMRAYLLFSTAFPMPPSVSGNTLTPPQKAEKKD